MTIEVRQASVDDVQALRPLLLEWIAECNPDGLRFDPDPDTLMASFEQMRTHPNGTTLVMVDGAELVGCLGLIRHNWGACRSSNFVSENLWYVKKSHAGHASTLVNAAKRWTGNGNYLIFSTNRLSTVRSGKGDSFLAALEFKPLYQLHIAEVNHV